MPELADIFRLHGPEYRARFGNRMLPSHKKAMEDILHCRTPDMGGHVYRCTNASCATLLYSYHSCCSRSCPKCGHDRTQRWLRTQQKLLIDTHYFLLTFTLPSELRRIARSNQNLLYDLMFKASAASLIKLAWDPRFVGGQIGMIGGLHTWTRDMRYHLHIHYIVPGGGLCADRRKWLASSRKLLVRVEPLSEIFRAKFRDALKKTPLFDLAPPEVWKKQWVVHSKPLQNGTAALKYIAPYVHRIAITNKRILKLEHGRVTFRYKDSNTGTWHTTTLAVFQFIRRFLQHVLPKGFVKIRYYGFVAPKNRQLITVLRYLFARISSHTDHYPEAKGLCCPQCGAPMNPVAVILYFKRAPPWLRQQ